jgi:hypothetical protein
MTEQYRRTLDDAQNAIDRRDQAHDELESILEGQQDGPLQPRRVLERVTDEPKAHRDKR